MNKTPSMIFRKIGGQYQLIIDTPEDLKAIPTLDEALWMCTGAPIESFICDKAFLKYLDSDENGRIRTDEVKDAVTWILSVLSDLKILAVDSEVFPLDAINSTTPEGKQLRLSAERVLANLELKDSKHIKLEHTRDLQKILASGECNGDGVIPVGSVTNKKIQDFINDIMDTVGSTTDASGMKGITSEHLDTFIKDAKAYLEWHDKGKLKHGQQTSSVMIWGDETATAYTSIKAVKDKLDEFFAQCRLLEAAPISSDYFYKELTTNEEFDMSDTDSINQEIKKAPLAPPSPDEILHFNKKTNPAFRVQLLKFQNLVLSRIKNSRRASTLNYDEWEELKSEFANYAEWESGKPGNKVEQLGLEKLRKYCDGTFEAELRPIFEKDLTVADEIKKIGEVEKLILYSRHLLKFTNNFISFTALFDPSALSMIQTGKLIMDGRHFDLNVKVKDRALHKKIAQKSNICVMYLKLTSKKDGKILDSDIATAVTSGNIRNLYIGKRGVFFTPDGAEWDAEVIDFLQQPVSISEALKMPFTKLGQFLKKQTDKFKNSTYNQIESGVGSSVNNVTKSIQKPTPTQKSSWTAPMMLLGGGIGLAGLGSAFASVMNALKNNTVLLKIGFFVLGLIIILAIPIIVSAILKLRRRNIGVFFEACGWSINTPMRLTFRLGLLFTRTPAFPENSEKRLFDYTAFFLKKINIQEKTYLQKTLLITAFLLLGFMSGYLLNRSFHIDQRITKWLGL